MLGSRGARHFLVIEAPRPMVLSDRRLGHHQLGVMLLLGQLLEPGSGAGSTGRAGSQGLAALLPSAGMPAWLISNHRS